MIHLKKIVKKSNPFDFFSKLILISCLWLQIFQISSKKFYNWVALCFGKVLKIKVIKGEVVISNCIEMVDQYLRGGGWLEEPTHWLGLLAWFWYLKWYEERTQKQVLCIHFCLVQVLNLDCCAWCKSPLIWEKCLKSGYFD